MMLVDGHDTGAYTLLGPMTYGGPPKGLKQNEGQSKERTEKTAALIPRPKTIPLGGWPRDVQIDLGPIAAT